MSRPWSLRRPSQNRKKAKAAFTLVEVLLGLIVAGIIGTIVYQVFWSGVRLQRQLKQRHDNYIELLLADQVMTRDFANAISIDLSISYPDVQAFDGKKTSVSFWTVGEQGIKRVRYYGGLLNFGKATATIIGGRIDNPRGIRAGGKNLPIEFLLRQELSVSEFSNDLKPSTTAQIVAAGLTKGTFNCRYGTIERRESSEEPTIKFRDTWASNELPDLVRCSLNVYDAQNPKRKTNFVRDFYLPPIDRMSVANEE